MSNSAPTLRWHEALQQTYAELSGQVLNYLPHLLGALLLLIIGWLVAHLVRLLAKKSVQSLESVAARVAHKSGGATPSFQHYARLGADLVFWCVMLFFIAAAAHLLQWDFFSGATRSLVSYLPRLLAGVMVVILGIVAGGMIRSLVINGAPSAGLSHGLWLGRLAQTSTILIAVIIGLEQVGINVAFITQILVVALGVVLAGVALAFGLGARSYIANVISVQSARRLFRVGQTLKIAEFEGRLLEISDTALLLENEQGRVLVPASLVQEQMLEIVATSGGSLSTDERKGS